MASAASATAPSRATTMATTSTRPVLSTAARRPPALVLGAIGGARASHSLGTRRPSPSSSPSPSLLPPPLGRRRRARSVVARAAAAEDGGADLASRFAAELSARAATPPPPSPSAEEQLDGAMIGSLIRQKYGLAYDVDLVARKWGPSVMVSVNVMWKHDKQASWRLTAEEYAARLEYVAMALRAWGQSEAFVRGLAATKEKPRVGKAAAIMLEGVSEERLREFVSF